MGQLTIARFRGDTTFGLVARIMSTFFGSILGMLMWYVQCVVAFDAERLKFSRYISCGTGNGNAYGLAAVAAAFFPPIFYARLYWPVPPMTKVCVHASSRVFGSNYNCADYLLRNNYACNRVFVC